MSTERLKLSRRDSRREVEDVCLSREEWCLDERFSLSDEEECFEDELVFDDRCDEEEDFSDGTSRMFKTRPVVGSVVDD